MKYLSALFLVVVLVGCGKESPAPKAIASARGTEENTAQSISTDSEALRRIPPTFTIKHQSRVDSVLFSPNSKMLASSALGVRLTDTRSGKLLNSLRGWANSIGFSQDGSVLAIGTNRGEVEIWNMETYVLKQTVNVTKCSIYAVALSSDGSILASCGADGTVQVWDLHEPKLKLTLGNKGERMSSLAFSQDGSLLASLSRYGRCCVWETSTGTLVGEIAKAGDGELGQVSFPGNGNVVAITTPFNLTLWNPRLKEEPQIILLPENINPLNKRLLPGGGPISCPLNTLSRDGKTVATSLENGTIAVWTVKTRTVICILVGDTNPDLIEEYIRTMAFSPDDQLLAGGRRNGKVQIWRIMEDHNSPSLPTAIDGKSP